MRVLSQRVWRQGSSALVALVLLATALLPTAGVQAQVQRDERFFAQTACIDTDPFWAFFQGRGG